MSRFRVPVKKEVNGEVKTEWEDLFWCDYAGCINWSTRRGIQNCNHLIMVDEDTHFCSLDCEEQAKRWDEKVAKEKAAQEMRKKTGAAS